MKITRREMMTAGAGALVLPAFRWAQDPDPYGGFKMGMQSYSLRHFDLDGALARFKELGLKYGQFYPGKQMPMTEEKSGLDLYKEKLSKAGVELLSYGVCGFGKDEGKNRKIFEFAKAMGIGVLTADPSPDSFENLSELTKEYGVKIAIHNHGPGARYDKIADVSKAVEKWPEAIGACVDTGHFIRSAEDPVKAIREFGARVHDVHLKDAVGPNEYAVVGKGKLDVLGTLKALKEVKFTGCLALEYEEKPENPMDDLKECLRAVREAVKKL